MSYQLKYYYEFYSQDTHRLNRVDIYQNTEDILVSKEVIPTPPAFLKEMPSMDHKFDVVSGSGCEINLLSETDMEFFDGFYHVDPKEFRVEHFIDGELNWIGYLNSEMTSESYEYKTNYPFQITGHDGFALMDRYSFIQTGGANYTGIKSKFEILDIIFKKIGLPWLEYRISLSTTFSGYSGSASNTILHESYMDCSNYYDEDGKPMSLRDVLESILAPYGAKIKSEDGNVIITDINTIAGGGDVTYKRFNYSTLAYVSDITEVNLKNISDIRYAGTGQSIDRSGGINRQVVTYSPYPVKEIIEESVKEFSEFTTVPDTWSTKDGYNYKTLNDNMYWNVFSPATFQSSYYDDNDDIDIYIRWPYLPVNQKVASIKINPHLVLRSVPWINTGEEWRKYAAIKIDGKILIKTKNNPYNDEELGVDYFNTSLRVKVKVGDDYADYPFGFDSNSSNFQRIYSGDIGGESISDKFVDMNISERGFTALVNDLFQGYLSGNLEIEIWSDLYNNLPSGESIITNYQEIWLSDLSVKLIRNDGQEFDDADIEFIGELDKDFQNEGEKITLTSGTDAYFTDRGRIMRTFDGIKYSYITSWTRAGQTYKIEELLLNSITSNYREGFIKLGGLTLKNRFKLRNVLTDQFIAGSIMMITDATIDYESDTVDCSLVEIKQDELIIEI